ncbi:MAG: amidohydrolase family protein [Desulfococcaceae bacterium]
MRVDLLVCNGTLITVNENAPVVPNGFVAVRDGRIVQVGSETEAAMPEPLSRLDAQGGLVLPGLVNAHTHLPMTLFRGLADDLPLETWLHDHIFPAEAAQIRPDTVGEAARHACAELLLGGATCCCDGYFLEDQVAAAVAETGIRAVLGQGVVDFPAPGVPDPKERIAAARDFVRRWKGRSGNIRASIFCHSPYTCSPDTLIQAKNAAREAGVLFQIHLAETKGETENIREEHGCGPAVYLDRLGVLDSDTLLVHCVWLDERDIEVVAERGCGVVHCPESNMKLASGVAPVPAMLAAGIPVGLGTDGAASNNDLDMFGEMAMAARLHKVFTGDPTVLDARTVIRMATLDGARAIGLGDEIGSLEVGKRADLIVLDANRPNMAPMHHPESQLVYSAGGGDVGEVVVGGRVLAREGRLPTTDAGSILEKMRAWRKDSGIS